MNFIRIPLDDKYTLEIKVKYERGGVNYFNGKTDRRGYYLFFVKKIIVNNGNYITEQYTPVSDENFKIFLKESKRYSSKTEKKLFDLVKRHENELIEAYKNKRYDKIFNILKNGGVLT